MSAPQAPRPAGYHFRDIQLEMSLKPFWDHTASTRDAVLTELFEQWFALTRFAESVSVMLWIGDGSEILEYSGDLSQRMEWGRYHGCANPIGHHSAADRKDSGRADHDAIGGESALRDPEKKGVHLRSYLYCPEPAEFDYAWLRELLSAIRRVGAQVSGKKIKVGATFDIGPEFSVSRFKYEWHPEICGGGAVAWGGKFISCAARLKGDKRVYAGFPAGIPDGLSFGSFFGQQFAAFNRAMGFDFLWFSNGFGFSPEPWGLVGSIFDGVQFHPHKTEETAVGLLQFWQDMRTHTDIPIRTRGTNLGTGIDLGSDASPYLQVLEECGDVSLPVNSPWAALDADLGLELAGWMSHIAGHPGQPYPFRFYIHDPWWLNSPWLDRYQRQPYDLFLPLAVSRLGAESGVEIPEDIAFLTVDDSHGCLPPTVPVEVTAHLLHAREFAPDAPGPIVWVYPFDEFHDLAFGGRPDVPFFADWFARSMIQCGCPLNTVANLGQVQPGRFSELAGSILVCPTLPGKSLQHLLDFARQGGSVLFYGPLRESEALVEIFRARLAEDLEGDFSLPNDTRKIRHTAMLSAGGWSETIPCALVTACAKDGAGRSASALIEMPGGGRIGWVRGSLTTAELDPANPLPIKGPRLSAMDPGEFLAPELLAREVLGKMGWSVSAPCEATPTVTIHRHRNAFVFSGYQPHGEIQLSTPLGAPAFPATANLIQGRTLIQREPHTWHHVCRAFIDQDADPREVTCRILPPIQHGYEGRILLSRLKNATVWFFPEPDTVDSLEILRQPLFPYFVGDFASFEPTQTKWGPAVPIQNVSGEILFSWKSPQSLDSSTAV